MSRRIARSATSVLGWTGDAQVFARTAAFNMDVADSLPSGSRTSPPINWKRQRPVRRPRRAERSRKPAAGHPRGPMRR